MNAPFSVPGGLNHESLDVLSEMINIGVGRASGALSELLASRIELTAPSVRVVSSQDDNALVHETAPGEPTIIVQRFDGCVSGQAALVFPRSSSLALANLLAGGGPDASELDVELAGILLEVGNIVLNGIMGSLANSIHDRLHYTVPEIQASITADDAAGGPSGRHDIVICDVRFRVRDREISGNIALFIPYDDMRTLVDAALAVSAID